MSKRSGPDRGWEHELNKTRHYTMIAGVDESGRGPLAGPVVAAAVVIPAEAEIDGVDDCKVLSPKKRLAVYESILATAHTGLGVACVQEIEEFNILQATFLAMRRSLDALDVQPDFCFVDGRQQIPGVNVPQRAIIRGDRSCFSIAAASIVAKVERDRIMQDLGSQYPQYGFSKHKGYPTKQHLLALQRYGPTIHHRITFRGVCQEVGT